ncbi:MAG: BlaI/MecI/CopY family transcriptional regulator [Cellvibrionaceae bacterium]
MDILYRQGESSAEDIREKLPDPPSNSAVRAMLSTLKQKEFIRSREENFRYVYSPAIEKGAAQQTALDRLVNTFFGGSTAAAVNALLGMQSEGMSEEELNDLKTIIDNAKKEESEIESDRK